MKKRKFRELKALRKLCNNVLGEEKTEQIIEETVNKVLEETKPKAKKGKEEKDEK